MYPRPIATSGFDRFKKYKIRPCKALKINIIKSLAPLWQTKLVCRLLPKHKSVGCFQSNRQKWLKNWASVWCFFLSQTAYKTVGGLRTRRQICRQSHGKICLKNWATYSCGTGSCVTLRVSRHTSKREKNFGTFAGSTTLRNDRRNSQGDEFVKKSPKK
jgi:hypothetical protein